MTGLSMGWTPVRLTDEIWETGRVPVFISRPGSSRNTQRGCASRWSPLGRADAESGSVLEVERASVQGEWRIQRLASGLGRCWVGDGLCLVSWGGTGLPTASFGFQLGEQSPQRVRKEAPNQPPRVPFCAPHHTELVSKFLPIHFYPNLNFAKSF